MIERLQPRFADVTEQDHGVRRIRFRGDGTECFPDSPIDADEHQRQPGGGAEMPARIEHRVHHHRQVPAFMEIADVQQVRFGDVARNLAAYRNCGLGPP